MENENKPVLKPEPGKPILPDKKELKPGQIVLDD